MKCCGRARRPTRGWWPSAFEAPTRASSPWRTSRGAPAPSRGGSSRSCARATPTRWRSSRRTRWRSRCATSPASPTASSTSRCPRTPPPTRSIYMLRHSGARVLIASDEEQLAKVLPALPTLPDLAEVVVVDRAAAARHGLLSLEQLVNQGAGPFVDESRVRRAAAVRSRDVATVMYTSGTTGQPKGIAFTHQNIVTKRLCRGFALPRLGEGDVFLCYLPLYHTFGRWLELHRHLVVGRHLRLRPQHRPRRAARGFPRGAAHHLHQRPEEVDRTCTSAAVQEAASDDPEETASSPRRDHRRAPAAGPLRRRLPRPPRSSRPSTAAGIGLAVGLRHDRGHRRDHHDPARGVRGAVDRRSRSPASSAAAPRTASCSSAAPT